MHSSGLDPSETSFAIGILSFPTRQVCQPNIPEVSATNTQDVNEETKSEWVSSYSLLDDSSTYCIHESIDRIYWRLHITIRFLSIAKKNSVTKVHPWIFDTSDALLPWCKDSFGKQWRSMQWYWYRIRNLFEFFGILTLYHCHSHNGYAQK